MALDYSQIQSAVEQQHAALAAQRGVDPSAVSMMDALAAYNQAQQQAYFAPSAAPAAAPAAAPQNFLNLTSPDEPAPANLTTAKPAGIAALPTSVPTYDPNKVKDLASLYQTVLGRAPDVSGSDYWKNISAGGISPEEYQEFVRVAQPELEVQKSYRDVLGRGADLSGLEYYTGEISKGALKPEDLRSSLAYGATNLADQLAAQKFLGKEIYGSPEDLRKGFQEEFGDVFAQTFGSDAEIAAFEKASGMAPGTLKSTYQPSKYELYGAEDIGKMLQQTEQNKKQEANRLATFAQNLYGYDKAKADKLYSDLITGKPIEDQGLMSLYNSFLTQGFTPELKNQVYTEAVKRNPNSEFFKQNPDLKTLYTPIDKPKSLEHSFGQYGVDKRGMPYLSLDVAKKIVGDGVFIGQGAFRQPVEGKDLLGMDLQGGHVSAIRTGTGIYGVTANNKQISDFDKIEQKIQELGGGKTITDPESGATNDYVDTVKIDPETGEKYVNRVSVVSLFETDPETSNAYDNYSYYKQTKERLDAAAKDLGVDPSAFKSIKEQYDVLNLLTKDTWAITTRNDWLDKEALRKSGAKEPEKENQYSTILFKEQGDKLAPVGVVKEFNFKDPNTTRGVLGDTVTNIGEVASAIPFGAEIITAGVAAINPAAAPYVYAGLKGSQTYAATGDPIKGLTTAGITYFAPKVAGKISSGLENLLPKELSTDIKSYLVKTGTEAAMSAGIAALTDQDAGKAAAAAVINSMFKNIGGKADVPGIPKEYQQVVKKILLDAATKKDIQKSVSDTITRYGINTLIKSGKDSGKTTVAAAP